MVKKRGLYGLLVLLLVPFVQAGPIGVALTRSFGLIWEIVRAILVPIFGLVNLGPDDIMIFKVMFGVLLFFIVSSAFKRTGMDRRISITASLIISLISIIFLPDNIITGMSLLPGTLVTVLFTVALGYLAYYIWLIRPEEHPAVGSLIRFVAYLLLISFATFLQGLVPQGGALDSLNTSIMGFTLIGIVILLLSSAYRFGADAIGASQVAGAPGTSVGPDLGSVWGWIKKPFNWLGRKKAERNEKNEAVANDINRILGEVMNNTKDMTSALKEIRTHLAVEGFSDANRDMIHKDWDRIIALDEVTSKNITKDLLTRIKRMEGVMGGQEEALVVVDTVTQNPVKAQLLELIARLKSVEKEDVKHDLFVIIDNINRGLNGVRGGLKDGTDLPKIVRYIDDVLSNLSNLERGVKEVGVTLETIKGEFVNAKNSFDRLTQEYNSRQATERQAVEKASAEKPAEEKSSDKGVGSSVKPRPWWSMGSWSIKKDSSEEKTPTRDTRSKDNLMNHWLLQIGEGKRKYLNEPLAKNNPWYFADWFQKEYSNLEIPRDFLIEAYNRLNVKGRLLATEPPTNPGSVGPSSSEGSGLGLSGEQILAIKNILDSLKERFLADENYPIKQATNFFGYLKDHGEKRVPQGWVIEYFYGRL